MKNLIIIDANALVHRAFHALPPFTTPQGEPIGAIFGLTSTLLKILKDHKPDYIVAAFDRPEPTFRDELFKEYKIQRPPTPDELISQIVKARELFLEFGILTLEKPGFEADDIIGSLVEKFKAKTGKDIKITILTGDLDTLQLVHKKDVVVMTPKKGSSEAVIYDETAVKKRFGLLPEQMPDYKGLVGDPSDNIPGVMGVGPKTAEKLLQEFGNLETLYKKIDSAHPLAKKIISHEKDALFSKKLAVIVKDIVFEIKLDDIAYNGLNLEKLTRYLTKLGFTSIVSRLLKPESTPKIQSLFETDKSRLPPKTFVFLDTASALKNKKALVSTHLKISFDWKRLMKELSKIGIVVPDPIFDLKIAGCLVDPDQKDFSLQALGQRFLYQPIDEKNPEHFAALFNFLNAKIKEYNLVFVFEKIEMPIVKILALMEGWGIKIDKPSLLSLKQEVETELNETAKRIYLAAGGTFNINSPKQLGQKLFEEMKIGGKSKKTSTGQASTAEEALLALKNRNPIIGFVLDYRENFKIKTSFIEPLLALAGQNDRVRTTYLQVGTATGRLASEKPNLQNIPQESKWSKRLRSAFVAETGWSLLSFDYSQLELRLLAHVAQDQKLIQAFLQNQDIHSLTAAQVFNVALDKVTPEMRRIGKTLNFGVVYGMGARGFSQTSRLSLAEAENFIEEYFHNFPEIKIWQEKTKDEATALGYVENPNGRRRWLLGIDSPNQRRRAELERQAINMPIQSLGADIIKLAMIQSFEFLKNQNLLDSKAKLLLSIHDELLFEVRDDILKEIVAPLKEIMESVYKIAVPLKVDTKNGRRWGEMKSYST